MSEQQTQAQASGNGAAHPATDAEIALAAEHLSWLQPVAYRRECKLEAERLSVNLSDLKAEVKLVKAARKANERPRLAPEQPELDAEGHDPDDIAEGESDPRPIVRVTPGKLDTMTTAAEAAIIERGIPIFQRGPTLVRPATYEVAASHGRTALAAGLHTLNAPALIDAMSTAAQFQRFDVRTHDWVRANPPEQVANILLSRFGMWNVSTLAGIITTPTLRPDGSVLFEPGYDRATRLYHVADPALKLDAAVFNPTRAAAETAMRLLLDLLAEFPFVVVRTDGQPDRDRCPSRSVAISGVITPVVRGAFSVAPMHCYRAATPGTGKSFLTDTTSAIATGRPCPIFSVAPGDPKETEKRLIAMLLVGVSMFAIDNVNGELGGDTLAQAIERPTLTVRPLGGSDAITIESRAGIYANGNGLTMREDMVRRALTADLDAEMERPELREFKGNPVETVMANRGKYVSACLIVARAYLEAGSPGVCKPKLSSFEEWSDLVRSAIVWLGCDDPIDVMEKARADDPSVAELAEVMDAWDQVFGSAPTPLKEVVSAATRKAPPIDQHGDPVEHATPVLSNPELLEVMTRISNARTGEVDAAKLGYWFRTHSGRVVRNRRFVIDGLSDGARRWKLVETRSP